MKVQCVLTEVLSEGQPGCSALSYVKGWKLLVRVEKIVEIEFTDVEQRRVGFGS